MMRRILSLTLVLTLILPALTLAAQKQKEKKPRSYVKIESVNPAENSVTITDLDKSNRTFIVDQFTKITVKGQPAKLAAVESGMKADYTVGVGNKLSRLDATDPPEEKTKKK
jgi:ABC-type oligopeptide transport system substrate-binding subunit